MNTALLLLFWSPTVLFASYAEFFGSSASTAAIGNQANLDPDDPSNNYYLPAILAHTKKIGFSLSLGSIDPEFKAIDGIVVKNRSNSDADERGRADVNYRTTYHGAVHLNLPIAHENAGNIGISFFSPVGFFVESDSGDPYLPEYVMYRSRYKRVLGYINYAHPLSRRFSLSLGAHLGLQSTIKADTQTSLNGAGYGSSTNANSRISPSLGAIASFLARLDGHHIYLTYQQEMKSNLSANVFGEINDPTGLLFNITLDTMLYYDPHTFRLGWMKRLGGFSSFLSLEYQLWKRYKTPSVTITRNSGILLPSNDYERLQAKDIVVPKVGLRYAFSDRWSLMAGLSSRPTPLKDDFSGNGNSIDSDSVLYALGSELHYRIAGYDFVFSASGQYHTLRERQIVKSPGQENGNPGDKIGSPGYPLGGRVLTGKLSAKIVF